MPSILITGASTGIGRATANLYASRGWTVIGTVRDTASRPEGLDGRVALERLDLASPGSGAALATRVLQSFGCPDVLMSNAGIVQFGPVEELTAEQFARIVQVNFLGQLEVIRGLLPAMRERRSGTVANITSLGGTTTFPFFAAYNSTKWAFEGVSEGLWHELKPFGIRVKAIEPGYVATPIWDKALPAEHRLTPEQAAGPYAPFVAAMLEFEAGITDKTPPDAVAVEIATAIDDTSDRLRYPVAAYARPITRARRLLGGQTMMRFFHKRWMGPGSG